MRKPPTPIDETARLMSLHSLRILDTAPEERFDRITRIGQRTFGVEFCLISLVDSARQWFKSRQGLNVCETSREVSFCGHAILSEHLLIVPDATADERFADNPLVAGDPHIRFYAGAPIRSSEGHRIGTICVIDSKPRAFTEKDELMLLDLAGMVEDELRVSKQVSVDELTQVANRRGFFMVARHMLALCRRMGTAAQLLFFDLDGFKQINDEHGHAAGDAVLQQFAKGLLKSFRNADVVARLGGDEFVVLLTSSASASDLAVDRLVSVLAAEEHALVRQLAWSVGRIEYDPARHDSVERLLAEGDARMYEIKRQRRHAGRSSDMTSSDAW